MKTMNDFLSVLQKNSGVLWKAALEHVELSFSAVMFGVVIAVPLGIILTRNLKIGKRVLAVLGILQTVPSMVMFGLLLPAFGIGKLTARIVLAVYSILPILRNTYTGILEVPQDLTEAATGMGMDRFQVLFRVKLPVALPVIFAGIRLSSVYIISWATVAAIIGGGGLGDIIYMGLSRYNHAMVLLGAIPASLLAIATSYILGKLSIWVTPKGIRRSGNGRTCA